MKKNPHLSPRNTFKFVMAVGFVSVIGAMMYVVSAVTVKTNTKASMPASQSQLATAARTMTVAQKAAADDTCRQAYTEVPSYDSRNDACITSLDILNNFSSGMDCAKDPSGAYYTSGLRTCGLLGFTCCQRRAQVEAKSNSLCRQFTTTSGAACVPSFASCTGSSREILSANKPIPCFAVTSGVTQIGRCCESTTQPTPIPPDRRCGKGQFDCVEMWKGKGTGVCINPSATDGTACGLKLASGTCVTSKETFMKYSRWQSVRWNDNINGSQPVPDTLCYRAWAPWAKDATVCEIAVLSGKNAQVCNSGD